MYISIYIAFSHALARREPVTLARLDDANHFIRIEMMTLNGNGHLVKPFGSFAPGPKTSMMRNPSVAIQMIIRSE